MRSRAAVARADGAAATLTRLDPGLSRELRAAGRTAWQILGGAVGDDRLTSGPLAAEAH